MFTIYEGNSYQLEALFEYNAAYILNSDGGFLSLNGRWLCGFERKIGRTTSYIAELWGVHEGLCLIQRKSLIGVEIQVDAEEAVYKSILGEKVHIYREANGCADAIANATHNSQGDVVMFEQSPNILSTLLFADVVGVSTPRLISL
ncbi:hypothetical protein AAZX31_20G037600 [Glycine max]